MKKTLLLVCVFLLVFSIVSASALDLLSWLRSLLLPSSLTNTRQTLQILSNIAKMQHDTTMAVLRAIGG
jgi:hypothetical protein